MKLKELFPGAMSNMRQMGLGIRSLHEKIQERDTEGYRTDGVKSFS